MAKASMGEYAAFHTPNGVRFMKNNKLASQKGIPQEVVNYLKKQLGENLEPPKSVPETPKYKRPSPEESARLKAESLQVPVELQRTDEEMAAARPQEEPQSLTGDTLSVQDFEEEFNPEPEEVPHAPETGETQPMAGATLPTPSVDADFLESVSIHTASIFDIAEALFNRFGLYTVYINRLPNADEINPLTGEMFSKYHHGIAYQAAIRAQNSGVLNRAPELGRQSIDENRHASANLPLDSQPVTMGQARRENSFAYRTSVRASQSEPQTEIIHITNPDGTVTAERREIPQGEIGKVNGAAQRYDKDEDQPLVEPQLGRQVIRPDW